MEIYVSIDGVLRNTIQKIHYHYNDYFLNGETDSEETFEYKISEPILNDNILNSFQFQSLEEYKHFIFVEFPIEIYGHARPSYSNCFYDLNLLIYKNSNHNFHIISLDEFGKSKPASLFFLSKNGFQGNNIKFSTTENINKLWNHCDMWITDNKKIIDACPKNKKVIKFETEYNKHVICDNTITNLTEIKEEWISEKKNTISTLIKRLLPVAQK